MSGNSDFEARKQAMMARLSSRRPPPKSSVTSTPSVIEEAEELLKSAEQALQATALPEGDLISHVENSLVTLPPGRLSRRLKETLNQLRQRFTEESQASKPSFSFSRKPPAVTKLSTLADSAKESELVVNDAPSTAPSINSYSVTKKNDMRQMCSARDGTDAIISDVSGSHLVFGFRPSTVHLTGVTNSTLVFLPVRTSILIRNCSGLTVVAAAQQIRIHDSIDLNLHVAIRGAVIIERCSGVCTAPYKMAAGLVEKGELPVDDKWDQIQDFNWLVTTRPSPNWSKMDEEHWKEFDLSIPE